MVPKWWMKWSVWLNKAMTGCSFSPVKKQIFTAWKKKPQHIYYLIYEIDINILYFNKKKKLGNQHIIFTFK